VGAALPCSGEWLGRVEAGAAAHDLGEQWLVPGRRGLVAQGQEVTAGPAVDLFGAGQGRLALGQLYDRPAAGRVGGDPILVPTP